MESRQELEFQLSEARTEYAEALLKITEIKGKLAFQALVASERRKED